MGIFPAFRFDECVNRRATNSMKWGIPHKLLIPDVHRRPATAGVAGMDFRVPAQVIESLHDAVSLDIFGYPGGPTWGYSDAVTGWQGKRFGWELAPSWVVPTSGVMTVLNMANQAFTATEESVLIQPPVYMHFHKDLAVNGCRIAPARLLWRTGVITLMRRFSSRLFGTTPGCSSFPIRITPRATFGRGMTCARWVCTIFYADLPTLFRGDQNY